LYDLVDDMKQLTVPTLVLTGDEDWPCLQPALLMKQNIPSAALSVMPNCGHTINIEDPTSSTGSWAISWRRWTRAAGRCAILGR